MIAVQIRKAVEKLVREDSDDDTIGGAEKNMEVRWLKKVG